MKIRYIALLVVIAALLLTATQALAGPAATLDFKHTPGAKGPGGHGNGNAGGNGQGGGHANGNNGNHGQGQNSNNFGNNDKNDPGANSSAPGKPIHFHRVGTVVAYLAGQSITIQDRQGNQFTFLLTASTKYLPKSRAASLGVGSYVTIIAPRKPHSGDTAPTALGVVIHPHAPTSFPTATPTSTSTSTATETLTSTSMPTDTPTETPTDTPTVAVP
jgi:hypothetical protein